MKTIIGTQTDVIKELTAQVADALRSGVEGFEVAQGAAEA